jgi:hypothetical protein
MKEGGSESGLYLVKDDDQYAFFCGLKYKSSPI